MDFRDISIRLRFIFLMLHLFVMVILFTSQTKIAENVDTLVLHSEESQVPLLWYEGFTTKRFTSMYSVSIFMIVGEMLSFLSGVSMLSTGQNQVSIICHLIGVCMYISLLYYHWCDLLFYVTFILSTFLPTFFETFPLMLHFFRRI